MSLTPVTRFSTYQQMYLRHWNGLYDLLLRERPESNDADSPQKDPQLLTPSLLDGAFNGLFARFFRHSAHCYATITKQRLAAHIKQDESLTPIPTLYEQLGVTEGSIDSKTDAKLGKQQRELNSLVKTHHEEWVQLLESSQHTVIETLQKNKIAIVDSEITEFKLLETRQALYDRLVELKLECFEQSAVLTVSDYLYYKTVIAIRNAFYRQQQPDEIAQMKKHLKKLKPTFTQITTDEQTLLSTQAEALGASEKAS